MRIASECQTVHHERMSEDDTTQQLRVVAQNLAGLTTEIKNSTAKLEIVFDKAIAQAEKNSQSSAKLARSLNIITGCLVAVGILQIFVLVWHR